MRDYDIFEIRTREDFPNRGVLIEWRSRVFEIDGGVRLRQEWAYNCDPHRLLDYIERLIGGTLRNFEACRVYDGRDMARALLPHFEREIHMFMERMERESMGRRYAGVDYGIGPDATIVSSYRDGSRFFFDPFGAPPENPKAKQKARELLLRNLDAVQEKSFKKDGTFRVTGKDSLVYTIKTARSFNVIGPDGTKYCGQLTNAPIEDQMLAQKLLLEHEPDKFFKNANVSPISGVLGGIVTTSARN